MKLKETINIIQKNEKYGELVEQIREVGTVSAAVGCAARPYLLTALFSDLKKPLLIITSSTEKARRLVEDLRAYSVEVELFPELETMPYDSLSPSPASVGKRFKVLNSMSTGSVQIWVSSIQSAMRTIAPASEALERPLSLKVGDEIDLHELAAVLSSRGYIRTPLVESQGQFSLRGGIVDIFNSSGAEPVRIELFGDEIESIRPFSVSTQRSAGDLEEIKVFGCRQFSLTEETAGRVAEMLSGISADWLEEEVGKIKDLQYFEGIDKYLPFFYETTSTVLDYLPADAILVVDEPEEVGQVAKQHHIHQQSYMEHLVEHSALVSPPQPYFKEPEDVFGKREVIELTSIGSVKPEAIFKASPIQPLTGKVELLRDVISDYIAQGMRVFLSMESEAQLEKMAKMLKKNDISYSFENRNGSTGVGLTIGDLKSGFFSTDMGLAIISSADIFGRKSIKRKEQAIPKGRAINDVADLKIGDYVVHSTHGIAVYAGLQRREVAGVVRDYALLEYAGSDRLFVPIDQLDRITRYIGAAGETPAVSRLGSSEWLKAKKKAKASVKKVAYDLLSLYATRAKAKGVAFSPDSPWQKELEDSFAYEETPDQLSVIEDVKRDMEQARPMDRLICGDVGYGKTEVAVRAAFKAVMDGKQVMVLVPTTILAQQHFSTFSDRLASFPVTVEMVSRFKPQTKQKDIIARFNRGSVDVLIGTHRLLQNDVKPFDLGLIVIDEEQRFGVNDKEKLRNFKKSVDVLTLSATPIPRTLQMSIAGVRDMSVIETPPEDRRPIVTHVGRYDEETMIQAIRRELGRGGQVYFVHNRVETIAGVARRVADLIPEARVVVAHGQMSEHQLEKAMFDFLNKKHDVLVCTTIIESGIDIPSVNTLIVDKAEMLGLAQLYQLRGRVGRSSERAYAYFFFSPQKLLTMQAFERLKTISDFTELGSGIKIAMRDLEIRGAGNLLGAEQHGHMSAVGFELYCQMLREAIDELEGKPMLEPLDLKIDLPVNAYLPQSYIAEESLRIDVYKSIMLASDISDIEQISLELRDRFGTYPEPVINLLELAKLRLTAKKLGISEISYQGGKARLSPIKLTKQQEVVLGRSYNNLVIRSDRNYLIANLFDPAEITPFLMALFDDIIGALTTGALIS